MNIYFNKIQNVIKNYGRQAGRKISWHRERPTPDKVTISEEGKNLLNQLAWRLNKQQEPGVENNEKTFKFKIVDAEKGLEETEEISSEEKSKLLERVVAKILKAKGDNR
ncbi:hypothetical protein Thein_0687 [Thermodesulfatator indicus DSM 15286]|uniref:Uncharacterized protein n=1 Tax=Thermodesulfatator indicus (strain DSM 15286 / JCM 11887 / CIR29812) TaxID=667014 RepID=F8AC12_THEID|nr:hypothetical protein [Thermodesulfatator indicus]AEH44567.1 hypothetical protein Thein_0687 [Thermodesulfatator indicus DSM 15286]